MITITIRKNSEGTHIKYLWMDLIILLISVVFLLFTQKIEWPVVGMVVLCTHYLGLSGDVLTETSFFGQPTDPALLLFLLIVLYAWWKFPKQSFLPHESRFYRALRVFLYYILFLIILDIVLHGISFFSILRTSRHWLFLLIFVPVHRIPPGKLMKAVDILFWLTVLVSVIIIMESLSGVNFFTKSIKEYHMGYGYVERGALPSTFSLLFLLLMLCGYGRMRRWIRYMLMGVLVCNMLISLTRSVFMALLIGTVMVLFFQNESKARTYIRILVAVVLFYSFFTFSDSFQTRFGEFREESISSNFRFELLEERIAYLSQKPINFLFGLGNITEDHFGKVFKVGLLTEDGNVIQLDTGDICWALSFLRTGMVGTSLIIFLFISFIRSLSRMKTIFPTVPLAVYMFIQLTILSMADTSMFFGYFWVMPLILQRIYGAETMMSKGEVTE